MSGKGKSRPRKLVETSLGKAPKDTESKAPDLAHLKKPIVTSVNGLKQILNLFQTATNEVQDYISYECDILYECRVCRTIFRSLANFILHKREFCREKFQFGGGAPEGGFVISDEESRSATPVDKNEPKHLTSIIDKLVEKQKIHIEAQQAFHEDLSKAENSDDDVILVESDVMRLEKITQSPNAVFQTRNNKSMMDEVMEMHVIDKGDAVIGTNGKACNFPRQKLTCSECNYSFSTEKTLNFHIKYKHNKTCTVFPCPDCKEIFSNAWSVYRHLYKVHRKTSTQVRRMRHLVHNSGIKREMEVITRKNKPLSLDGDHIENQWMNNIESDKEFQMCGGCGKRFERKAALHSHSQMCTKRIALCNSIKADKKDKKDKEEVKVKEGAAKRKQIKPITFKKPADVIITPEFVDVPMSDEVLTISDESNDADEANAHWLTGQKTVDLGEEFKEYVNDDIDNCFLGKLMTYIDRDRLKCQRCDVEFTSLYMLLRHMSLHFDWYRFQCSKCSFVSFHQYDCTTHACSCHSTPNTLIESTVLPIPKWKVLATSHDFAQLEQKEEKMPQLEAVIEEGGSDEEKIESIVLDDDDMPDITETGSSDAVAVSDEEKDGKKQAIVESTIANRPIRKKTQSVRTLQNDFIYDLSQMLPVKNRKKK